MSTKPSRLKSSSSSDINESADINALLARRVIPVLVKPGAPKTVLLGVREGKLHIALHAEPIEGEANKELLRFLKKTTGFAFKVKVGSTSKSKLVERI